MRRVTVLEHNHDRADPGGGARRLPGLALLAFAIVYCFFAANIEYSFASDPWGPRAFPLFLGILLAALSVRYAFRPGLAQPWPKGDLAAKIAVLLGLCVFTAALYTVAGFPVATFLMCGGIARLFRATLRQSVAVGVANAAIWYALFTGVFGVPLPLGFGLGS